MRSSFRSRKWLTVSNALEMSRERTVATPPVCYIVWICSRSSSSTVLTDLPGRLPIWASRRRPSFSAKSLRRRASSASIVLPIVLRRAIGRYDPGSSYVSLSGFRKTTVQAALNCLG